MSRPMREKLEPCPFCGGHAELTQYDAEPGRWWRVECRYCCAKSPGAKYPELAAPSWNRRSASAERGLREALEEAAKWIESVGRDWKADGQHEKRFAADYLAAGVRSLSPKGEG